MALLDCPECQRRVSDRAITCPGCGYPLQEGVERPAEPISSFQPEPASISPESRVERFDSISHSRPVWVYLVVSVYLALAAVITFGPLVVTVATDTRIGPVVTALLYAVVILVSGLSLLVIPIGSSGPLPDRQRRIWFPLAGSGFLAVLVFFGFAIASHEFAFRSRRAPGSETIMWAILLALPVVWLIWVLVFASLSSSIGRLQLNGRLYRTLFAGSVLELLVAIPMHMVVRKRDECCAGMMTALGIGIGLIVMLIAMGPAVYYLFYHRYQQVYAHRAKRSE